MNERTQKLAEELARDRSMTLNEAREAIATIIDKDIQYMHERQDAAFDVEAGEAAYMLTCGHALPHWSVERNRVVGKERYCGICQAWVEKA